jgi:hypothetical protein
MDLRVAGEALAEAAPGFLDVDQLEERVAGEAEHPRVGVREEAAVPRAVRLVAGKASETVVPFVRVDERPPELGVTLDARVVAKRFLRLASRTSMRLVAGRAGHGHPERMAKGPPELGDGFGMARLARGSKARGRASDTALEVVPSVARATTEIGRPGASTVRREPHVRGDPAVARRAVRVDAEVYGRGLVGAVGPGRRIAFAGLRRSVTGSRRERRREQESEPSPRVATRRARRSAAIGVAPPHFGEAYRIEVGARIERAETRIGS